MLVGLPAYLLALINAPAATPTLLNLVADELLTHGAKTRRLRTVPTTGQVGEALARRNAEPRALVDLGAAGVALTRAVEMLHELAHELAGDLIAATADASEGDHCLVYTPRRRACVEAGAHGVRLCGSRGREARCQCRTLLQ
jgi:hypothetical protein